MSGIPSYTDSPAPPFSWRTDLIGLLGVTLMAVVLIWPALDGSRTLMSDSWYLNYPWAVERSVEVEAAAQAFGDGGVELPPIEEPYVLAYDVYFEFLIWYAFAQDEIASGRIPHWNPYAFCGSPFYANHLVPLAHPPLLAAMLVASRTQINTVVTFLTWWLAGLGLYLYLRTRRLQPTAALTGVALYFTCGHFMPLVPFQMSGLMYFPWLLWASDALEARPSFARLLPFALLVGLELSTGHPGFVAPFLYLLVLHRILIWVFTRKPPSWWLKRAGVFAVAFLLGCLLSSVQNIPTWQHLQLSSRELAAPIVRTPYGDEEPVTAPEVVEESEGWALPEEQPGKTAILFAPVFQRTVELQDPYVGIPLVLLALIGYLCLRPRPERATLIILLVLFTLLATPPIFAQVARFIPGLTLSPRIPVQTPQFVLVLLASVGVHELMAGSAANDARRRWALIGLAVIGAIMLLVLFVPPALMHPDTRWESEQLKLAVAVIVMGVLAILLLGAAMWWGARRPWLGGFVLPLILTVAGFLGHFYQYPVFSEQPVMPETPSTAALPRSPLYRVVRHSCGPPIHAGTMEHPLTFGGNLPMWVGCLDAQGADSFVLERSVDIMKALDARSFAWTGLTLPLTDPRALSSPLLDAMAIGVVISDTPDLLSQPDSGVPRGEWELIHEGGLNIYQRKNALPRWYLADEVVVAADFDEALTLMQETSILSSGSGVVLESADVTLATSSNGDAEPGQVSLVEETPQYLEFSVNASADCFLVLADSFHPEWHAYLDGEETVIHLANGAYRAVMVPAGTHTVVFRYVPSAFWLGALISGCVLLLLLIGYAAEALIVRRS